MCHTKARTIAVFQKSRSATRAATGAALNYPAAANVRLRNIWEVGALTLPHTFQSAWHGRQCNPEFRFALFASEKFQLFLGFDTFGPNRQVQSPASTIIRAVIALGRGLNLPVVAEGVETEEQLKFLAGEQCNEIQGYIVGRPKPIEKYAEAVGRAPTSQMSRRRTFAAAG